MDPTTTLSEHQAKAARKKWAGMTKEQRTASAKKAADVTCDTCGMTMSFVAPTSVECMGHRIACGWNQIPQRRLVGQLKRYYISAYNDFDVEGDEPEANWEADEDASGDWVKYDDVIDLINRIKCPDDNLNQREPDHVH
jgi:hypothetical protein